MNTLGPKPPENLDAPADGAASPPPGGLDWRRIDPVDVVAIVAVAAGLVWSYWPTLTRLYQVWVREPDYSHGFLVLPIALVILWKLWPAPGPASPVPWPLGWVLVVVALLARWHFHEQGSTWSESATLLP